MAKRLVVALAPDSYSEVEGRLVGIGAAKAQAAKSASDEKLQQNVVQMYLLNKAFADAMAVRFKFHSLTYWQPCLLDKNRLTAYEQVQERSDFFSGERRFDRAICRRVAAIGTQSGIHDLTALFRDREQPYFIDEVHVSGDGNRVIAEAMLSDVTAALEQTIPGRAANGARIGRR